MGLEEAEEEEAEVEAEAGVEVGLAEVPLLVHHLQRRILEVP